MKSHLINCIVAGTMLLFCQNAFAQGTATISPQRLPLIEQEMFNDSNSRFIVVDLFIDKLIEPGRPFDFIYDKGTVTLNGKKLAAPLQEKYIARMRSFQAHQGLPETNMAGVLSGGFTMDEVLDPNSALRTWSKDRREAFRRLDRQNTEARIILGRMANEQLLDTSGWYHVAFDQTGVYVNEHKLKGAVEEKYVQFFNIVYDIRPGEKTYSCNLRGSPRCITAK